MRATATTPRRFIRRWTRGTGCGAPRHSRSCRSSSAAPVTRPANVGEGAAPPARARRRGCRRVAPAAGDAERLSAHRRGDRVGGARAAARHGFSARRNHDTGSADVRLRRLSGSWPARAAALAERCRPARVSGGHRHVTATRRGGSAATTTSAPAASERRARRDAGSCGRRHRVPRSTRPAAPPSRRASGVSARRRARAKCSEGRRRAAAAAA